MFVLASLLLAAASPIPPPAAGGESFSEVLEALATVDDPARLQSLHGRGQSQANAPSEKMLLGRAADAAAERLGIELKPTEGDRPLPKKLRQLRPDSADSDWLAVASAAASLAYEPPEIIRAKLKSWGFRSSELFENSVPGTRAFLAGRKDHVLVVFCGTEFGVMDLLVDASIDQVRAGRYGGGRVHRGFDTALTSVWSRLERAMEAARKQDPKRPFLFTGHSLGGGLATLAYARARAAMRFPTLKGGAPSARLITLGAPRVGDETFAKTPIFRPDAVVRVIHRHDPVPHALVRGLGYHHVVRARTLWIDDTRALHDLAPEDAARDELPQTLDLAAISRWIEEGKVRFEDHNESNYSVLLNR